MGNEALDPERTYTLAVADYLVSGNEQGFGFLNSENPLLEIVGEARDVRLALIEERKRGSGGTVDSSQTLTNPFGENRGRLLPRIPIPWCQKSGFRCARILRRLKGRIGGPSQRRLISSS